MLVRSDDALDPAIPLVDLDLSSVVEHVPESIARQFGALPISKDGETLSLAMADTEDFGKQDKIRFLLNCNVRAYQRTEAEIQAAIDHFYGEVEGTTADSLLIEEAESISCLRGEPADEHCLSAYDGRQRSKRARSSRHALQRSFSANEFKNGLAAQPFDRSRGMFYYIVDEGNKVLVRRHDGRSNVVSGPARVWRGFNSFHPMQQYVAHPGQYLKVLHRDGTQRHLTGPSEIWLDPRIHETISVETGLTLATNEAVVVYGKDLDGETAGNITRRVFFGPGVFIAEPGEWLHQFSWHASHGGSRGVEKKPHGRKFETLWLMPDQMYHDVRDVRTADDAVLTIRLMIFFELKDIEKMLDTTHDPIGDFVNAATSDVVEFTGKRTFEQFKGETKQLNETATYTQLLHRASQCGYQINNVVYRGYGAPDSLQRMHDEAIQSRTKLQLERETERQAQDLEDYKLQCQMERATKRREEQTNEIEHEIDLDRRRAESQRQAEAADAGAKRELQRLRSALQSEIETQQLQLRREHLDGLKQMGVDLTEYLTQGKADQVIEMRGEANSRPHIHLDKNSR